MSINFRKLCPKRKSHVYLLELLKSSQSTKFCFIPHVKFYMEKSINKTQMFQLHCICQIFDDRNISNSMKV
eukprot:UN28282